LLQSEIKNAVSMKKIINTISKKIPTSSKGVVVQINTDTANLFLNLQGRIPEARTQNVFSVLFSLIMLSFF